jgi:DNA invertase Pin-like site-specific DNA recombinase
MSNNKIYIPNFNTFADIVDRLAVTTNKLAYFENKKREESQKENPDTVLIANYDRLSRNECEYRNLLKRAMDDLLSEIIATGQYKTLKDNRTFSAPAKSISDLIEEICYVQANNVKKELVERLENGL